MTILRSAVFAITLTFLSGAAHAIPVPFEWSGGSIDATGAFAIGSYTPAAGSTSPLANGETSGELLFGEVSVIGVGAGELEIGVDFTTPNLTTQAVSGPYGFFSFWIFSGGHWSGGSTDFAYHYMGNTGMARLTMAPIDIPRQWGKKFEFTGSITNLGSESTPLSEPGSLGLLAIGLAAVAWIRRREIA